VRADLSVKASKIALDLGIPVISVDGGSTEEWQNKLVSNGVKILPQMGKTMGAARRQGICAALAKGADVVVYSELEKISFISEIPKLAQMLIQESAAMVIPRRLSLESYPFIQRNTETLGNMFWTKLTGVDLDTMFGPRIFSRDAARYFTEYCGEYGDRWDSIFIPVLRAVHAAERVIDAPINYVHPKEQVEVEAPDFNYLKKRLTQLHSLTDAFETEWNRLASRFVLEKITK